MNSIWLLYEQTGIIFTLFGVVSSEKVSEKWCNIKPKNHTGQSCYNFRQGVLLDSPELLNRIAKTKIGEGK